MPGSVVIVTYNSVDDIDSCLAALELHAPDWKVVVVDNRSIDPTVEHVKQHPGVLLIENQSNLGFAAAVNQGVQAMPAADPILLLNPDARLQTGIEPLAEACRQHGLAAGRLVDSSGNTQTGFSVRHFPTATTLALESLGFNRLFPSNPVNRRYRCLDTDLSHSGLVEQPAGALLMFRRDVWKSLGGFDERFFPVWFEDVDFCRRAIDSGYEIFFEPNVTAQHTGGASVGRIPTGKRAVFWYVSLLRYAAKHFTVLEFRWVSAAVAVGSIPRVVTGAIQERSLQSVRAYWKVIWVSILSLVKASVPELSRVQ